MVLLGLTTSAFSFIFLSFLVATSNLKIVSLSSCGLQIFNEFSFFLTYLTYFDFIFFFSYREDYILHPINAFHLMKRAVQWWPKFNLTSPEKSDFIFGASYGLVSIQAYHELDMMKMSEGIIEDPTTNEGLWFLDCMRYGPYSYRDIHWPSVNGKKLAKNLP